MLIKSADDKSKRLDLLQGLQDSPLITPQQRTWLRDELCKQRRGIQGERDAAYYIDSAFKDSPNFAVIHDLRIKLDDEVAQIDHLMVDNGLQFYLLETKCFNGNLVINEHGEFSVEYADEKCFGIPSPLEQSKRHERILLKLLERLEITGRMGIKPAFHYAVLVHPKAIITRPDPKRWKTDDVIKADQIGTWHQAYVDRSFGLTKFLTAAANLQTSDTVREWAAKISRQHRPQDLLALPDFMKPKVPEKISQPSAQAPQVVSMVVSVQETKENLDHLRRRLICLICREKISFAEGRYCWNNEHRFGGFQYCREHQGQFR